MPRATFPQHFEAGCLLHGCTSVTNWSAASWPTLPVAALARACLLFGWAANLGTPQTVVVSAGKVTRAHLMNAALPQVAPTGRGPIAFGCSLCCSRLRSWALAASFHLEHVR